MAGIAYEAALAAYRASEGTPAGAIDTEALLTGFHPDRSGDFETLRVGANAGARCPSGIARRSASTRATASMSPTPGIAIANSSPP